MAAYPDPGAPTRANGRGPRKAEKKRGEGGRMEEGKEGGGRRREEEGRLAGKEGGSSIKEVLSCFFSAG
jgi:hypothetical protein